MDVQRQIFVEHLKASWRLKRLNIESVFKFHMFFGLFVGIAPMMVEFTIIRFHPQNSGCSSTMVGMVMNPQ